MSLLICYRVMVKAKEMVQVPLGAKAMVVMVDSNLEHNKVLYHDLCVNLSLYKAR